MKATYIELYLGSVVVYGVETNCFHYTNNYISMLHTRTCVCTYTSLLCIHQLVAEVNRYLFADVCTVRVKKRANDPMYIRTNICTPLQIYININIYIYIICTQLSR